MGFELLFFSSVLQVAGDSKRLYSTEVMKSTTRFESYILTLSGSW